MKTKFLTLSLLILTVSTTTSVICSQELIETPDLPAKNTTNHPSNRAVDSDETPLFSSDFPVPSRSSNVLMNYRYPSKKKVTQTNEDTKTALPNKEEEIPLSDD